MSNSHRKPTGNQRELSHTTKAARKIYMLPGRRGPVALGGICEAEEGHTVESCLGSPSCMLRGPLGQTEELEGLGLCFQGVCTSWLPSSQDGVRLVLIAAILKLGTSQPKMLTRNSCTGTALNLRGWTLG